ncbi:hypothetical protein IQ266_22450 [filamentous cyanobacterium LEGE 11480]|uniref:Uncharacterized protein n=1 Tax=Romeriopsis navalis LEGE 11480 TaxID=2777977 RepID=A0A928VPQ0_9CYAN|nr:hypothetical protein [Romeriopsis navalis]MBE9032503.1 hypothetical protein [Romeriopsis navalis LEGE 11480]
MPIPRHTHRSSGGKVFMDFVQTADGSLRLTCPKWEIWLATGVLSVIGAGLVLAGLRLLLIGQIFGLLFVLMGGGLFVGLRQLQGSNVGSEFDRRQRVAILRDVRSRQSPSVVFDRIKQIQVRSGGQNKFSLSIVEVITDDATYTITQGWEMWQAEDLAQRLGGIVQCSVVSAAGQSLPAIARPELTPRPRRPQAPLSARILTGISYSLIGLLIVTTGYMVYRAEQPLTQVIALSGPTVIAVNQQGELHLYSVLHGRIQVFDADGKFQHSIKTAGHEGKSGANLCGGGEHPILLENRTSRTVYDIQKTKLTYRKKRGAPKFCRRSRNKSVAAWNDRLYIVKDWPMRLIMRQRGQVDRVIIRGSWWETIAGKSLFFFGITSGLLFIMLWIGLCLKIRHDSVE